MTYLTVDFPAGALPRHLLGYMQMVQAAEASPNATADPLLAVGTVPPPMW